MIFPYLSVAGAAAIPSLGGSFTRPRPVIAVRVTGPTGSHLIDGLLDTGSDETVFEDWLAGLLGIDLSHCVSRDVGLVGRVQPVRVRYTLLNLRVTDGMHEVCDWTALIGFTANRLRYPLFGYAGFLQFFNTDFHGDDCQVFLTANTKFPGTVTQVQLTP
jgi:hypothetical protein